MTSCYNKWISFIWLEFNISSGIIKLSLSSSKSKNSPFYFPSFFLNTFLALKKISIFSLESNFIWWRGHTKMFLCIHVAKCRHWQQGSQVRLQWCFLSIRVGIHLRRKFFFENDGIYSHIGIFFTSFMFLSGKFISFQFTLTSFTKN